MEKLLILSLIAIILFFFPIYMTNAEETEKKRDILKATFAGGCFWCVESDFEKVEGVIEAVSGYTGGDKVNPTYEEVSAGATGHAEVVQVFYDPSIVSYEELLGVFWRHIDPTDAGGQFVDRGSQYRSAIFYHNEEQREIAEVSKAKLDDSGIFEKEIVTEIVPLGEFYRAEDYHQDYYNKNKIRYKFYRFNSGRDQYLDSIWKNQKEEGKDPPLFKNNEYVKPEEEELKNKLSPLQYEVTQKEGTEPPFKNEYWDNKREGIYVDIVTGEPLFSSTAKFESGTGWPSFTNPIKEESIIKREDRKLLMTRTEVRSRFGDSHLGHVFDDGPGPTGLRYCINSASLRFIPKEDLEKEGYEEYLRLFDNGF